MRSTFWRRNAAAKTKSASAKGDFAFRYTVPYTASSAVASIALITPTITLPIANKSAIRTASHGFDAFNACHNRASLSPCGSPDLFERRPVLLQIHREEIGCRVRVPRGTREQPIPHEEGQVVPERAIVQTERLGELVAVPGPIPDRLEDARAVRAAPRPPDQVPQKLTERRAHSAREGPATINIVPRKGKGARGARLQVEQRAMEQHHGAADRQVAHRRVVPDFLVVGELRRRHSRERDRMHFPTPAVVAWIAGSRLANRDEYRPEYDEDHVQALFRPTLTVVR